MNEMNISNQIILDDYYKLRITSKRLNSGRYQVKFFATLEKNQDIYGYLLAESGETLKSVIVKIRRRLRLLEATNDYHHFHLFEAGNNSISNQLMIFQ